MRAKLVLAGRHRFSSYALTFVVEDRGDGRSTLRALTNAAFPGPHGSAYRALVIGSGAHKRLVRSMVAGIASAAGRRPSRAS
jgi:hypothetical protein